MTTANDFVSRILDDEGLTKDLNDPEARMFVEWLVEQVEKIAGEVDDEEAGWKRVDALCRRARLIRRFVFLWCERQDHAAAAQFVASERLNWPLPASNDADPCEVMQAVLRWHQFNFPI